MTGCLPGSLMRWYRTAPAFYILQKNHGLGRVEVVGKTFAPQDYAMATVQGSHLREKLNRVLLSLKEQGHIDELREEWFGAKE